MGKIIVLAPIFILFFLIKTISSNVDQDKISKSDIIKVIKNPIRAILMIPVVDLCTSIGFYPIVAQILSYICNFYFSFEK
jgi:hypothetical protein